MSDIILRGETVEELKMELKDHLRNAMKRVGKVVNKMQCAIPFGFFDMLAPDTKYITKYVFVRTGVIKEINLFTDENFKSGDMDIKLTTFNQVIVSTLKLGKGFSKDKTTLPITEPTMIEITITNTGLKPASIGFGFIFEEE